MLTAETCFENPEFLIYSERIENACSEQLQTRDFYPGFIFDDGWQLNLLLKGFNNQTPLNEVIDEMIEGLYHEAWDDFHSYS